MTRKRFGADDYFLGIFEGHADPAAALVQNGRVIAHAEEERHVRNKHAFGQYPLRALSYCLDTAGISIEDVAAVGVNWNVPAFTDGRMEAFFAGVRETYEVDPLTIAWQNGMLRRFEEKSLYRIHSSKWRRHFGDKVFPQLEPVEHHYVHAFQSAIQSPFDESVVVTVDGSGDQHCTVLWRHEGMSVTPLREVNIPHSLGWVYAAITEYLGFEAYDGEYKVMGLAAYGRPNPGLRAGIGEIVKVAADGIGYEVDPTYIHFGARSYSDRFTDKLVELLGRPPRTRDEAITEWHEDLAYSVQDSLEETIERLVLWGIEATGFRNVSIGGGVGLNIKMNSRLFLRPEIDDVFANPLCSDAGAAVGAALAACHRLTGAAPEKLRTLALGWEDSEEDVRKVLDLAKLDYEVSDDVCEAVADELAKGRIVGWFQGRMEAGARALGQRSILADPRNVDNRDKVNAIIKFREYWRPFCPSMTWEDADKYFDEYTDAPFMTIAFPANEKLKRDAPAIVHVDGTSRVQFVHQETHPLYHRLIKAFEKRSGVPIVLNTSFNIKGEPIVCTIQDALRTFWSTGLEVLAAGNFIIRKPRVQ